MRLSPWAPWAASILAIVVTCGGLFLSRQAGKERVESEEEEATFAQQAYEWRRLAWLDEKGKVSPDAHRIAMEQRDKNASYWASLQGDGFPRAMSPILWNE